jgi:hypothetical protein
VVWSTYRSTDQRVGCLPYYIRAVHPPFLGRSALMVEHSASPPHSTASTAHRKARARAMTNNWHCSGSSKSGCGTHAQRTGRGRAWQGGWMRLKAKSARAVTPSVSCLCMFPVEIRFGQPQLSPPQRKHMERINGRRRKPTRSERPARRQLASVGAVSAVANISITTATN